MREDERGGAGKTVRNIRNLFRASLVAALALTASGAADDAPTLTTLWSFAGGSAHPPDGASPHAGLIIDRSGTLYGTTGEGGDMSCRLGGGAGCGTVFKLAPPQKAGQPRTETVLHSFGGSDGAAPVAGLIFDGRGALYGTTSIGGAFRKGVVFKLAPPQKAGQPWTETVLHSFGGSDGAAPVAGLIFDGRGALYGTTSIGGAFKKGVVFKLAPPQKAGQPWTETVLYSFTGGRDGAFPKAGLLLDRTGALYGTTSQAGNCPYAGGCGTVFKLMPPQRAGQPWTETLLHRFIGGRDGAGPVAGLLLDRMGALYSTTDAGGIGEGTVFKLTPPSTADSIWSESVLYNRFSGGNGADPVAGLIMDRSGALYGTTESGGNTSCHKPYGCGTVFKLAPPSTAGGAWTEIVLYNFTGGDDGAAPVAGLIMDRSGALYGTTESGGNTGCHRSFGCGTVFKLVVSANFG